MPESVDNDASAHDFCVSPLQKLGILLLQPNITE